jgi:hypothetical protein
MTAKKLKMPKVTIEDSVANEFANLPKSARDQKVLITGFVAVLEVYDGNTKKLKVIRNKDLTDWAANGMIGWAQGSFSQDPEDDDDFYNPEWYWEQ